ncbi:hypothetical protein ACLF3G_23530 [Falsiroseomonas sp. HC035]|uniref:hypothetical protein n=1 Tax=Falsiroseomonas sp. HC035 TaxID=3390999 RepID=UPI003D3180B0
MSDVAAYIQSVELPSARSRGPGDAPPRPPEFTDAPQGVAIGSQLTEFTSRVGEAIRPAISNSLLLAQLAAEKANPGDQDPRAWFGSFNTVLGQVGWVPVGGVRATQEISDRDAELHKAIIPVLAAALGPAAAAGSIVISVLQGLQAMDEDAPWLTLFRRKSQRASVAQFGINFIDGGDGGGAALKAVHFSLTATRVLTQVLFARLSEVNASVSTEQRELMLSSATIAAAEDPLEKKLGRHIADNIMNIDI